MQTQMTALTSEPDIAANDLILAKDMADTLHAHYPQHMWGVHVDGEQGIAIVYNLRLSGQWGYILKLASLYSMSSWKKRVIHAGGELLEHFRMKAGAFNQDRYDQLNANHAGHFDPIPA